YTPLDIASSRLQSKGAAVFVLGIGDDVDSTELSQIASGPKNVFTVDSFNDLDRKADETKRGICIFVPTPSVTPTPTPTPGDEVCPIPMDTTFIIDSSLCDSDSNWNRLLYFVQTLVSFFNVSPSVGRIALVQFSTDARVLLKFNTLSGNLLNG
ncbi:unnamed protein product, partial [Porites lobata]